MMTRTVCVLRIEYYYMYIIIVEQFYGIDRKGQALG